MNSKLESIKSEDIKLNEQGNLEISEALQDAIAGGVDSEDSLMADTTINVYQCGKTKVA